MGLWTYRSRGTDKGRAEAALLADSRKDFASRLGDVAGQDLASVQPSGSKHERELLSDSGPVARLRWLPLRGRAVVAIGESLDGSWTFSQNLFGFRVAVSRAGHPLDVATFKRRLSSRARLDFAGGHRYRWEYTNFWCTEGAFKDEQGRMLARFTKKGILNKTTTVYIEPAGASLPELPMLALVGWFVILEPESGRRGGWVGDGGDGGGDGGNGD